MKQAQEQSQAQNQAQIVKTFASRQNKVQLLRNPTDGTLSVCKRFADPARCRLETDMLRNLAASGVRVPPVLASGDAWIRMAYVDGPTLCDHLEEAERTDRPFDEGLVLSLTEQVRMLHESPAFCERQLIWQDVNLRNCLVAAGEIWLIDFESVAPGRPVSDISGLLAFFLTYDPAFSPWKMQALRQIQDLFGATCTRRADFRDALAVWLARLGERRHVDYLSGMDLTLFDPRVWG
jgi:predicted Ser/Thr protein kinase